MNKLAFILATGDLILVTAAYFAGLMARFGSLSNSCWSTARSLCLTQIGILAASVILTSTIFELYSWNRSLQRVKLITRITISVVTSFALLAIVFYTIPEVTIGRGVLIVALGVFGICQYLWHSYSSFVFRIPGLNQRCMIVGVGDLACDLAQVIEENPGTYKLVGFIQPEGVEVKVDTDKIIGMIDSLPESAVRERVGKIIVALSERRGVLPYKELLNCRFAGIEVIDAVTFYEQATGKLKIGDINPDWFIYSNGFAFGNLIRFIKRGLDIILALVGIVLTLPLMLLIAIAIKLESPGEVIFSQVRVGEYGREFKIYKFRSMCQNAEVNGPVWAREDDSRVTRVGHFLRKTRLDEIPQLFNVLKGDMSLVGPRPERPEFVVQLDQEIPYYAKRHSLKPGVTGWAQVCYPYGASVEDSLMKLKYDLYYIKNFSLLFDLKIILETVRIVLFGKGR
jgi:sugar transferase (PEP-CTERM system associated)